MFNCAFQETEVDIDLELGAQTNTVITVSIKHLMHSSTDLSALHVLQTLILTVTM